MNKFIALTKIQLKDFFSRYTQQLNIKNKKLGFLVLLLPIFILLPIFQSVTVMYQNFEMIGYPELTLTYLYVAATTLVFFAGIPLIVSVFFYSKDMALLATLPVREDTIIFSKIASIYIYLLGVSAAIFGTTIGIYLWEGGFDLVVLIAGVLGVLLTPIMPMILSILLILPFMTFIGGRKNRNLMVIVGNLVLIVLIIGMQLIFTRIQLDPISMQKYLADGDGLISLIGHRFPPSIWLTKMIKGSLLDTLYYLMLNLGFVVLLRASGKFIYRHAMTKYNVQATQSTKKGKLSYKKFSKRAHLVKRHIGIIISNPTFLLNTVMTIFVPILLFGIYTIMGLMSLDTFKEPMLKPFLVYIYAGIISAPTLMGSLSATVISREGKTFWETRVLPISAQENINTRVLSTLVINGGASVILGFISLWFLPVTFTDVLLALLLCITGTVCFSMMDLIINIQRPFLNWSTPTAAVKNNLNVMIAILPRLIFGVAIFGLFKILPEVAPMFHVFVMSLLFTIGAIVSYVLLSGRYRIKFIKMDI